MSYLDQNFLNCHKFISSINKEQEFKNTLNKAKDFTDNLELPDSLTICNAKDDLEFLIDVCNNLKDRNVVILGIGGSSLGGNAIHDFYQKYNLKKESSTKKYNTKLFFFDNIDVNYFEKILEIENPFIIVISKSGETTETLMQFQFVIDLIQNNNFLIITENKDSSLMKIAKSYKISVIEHPKSIGGRFSIFSSVGLIPAILSNIDPYRFRESASAHFNDFKENIATASSINYILQTNGFNINPLLIYSDRLQKFGDWFIQLWSESLGKNGFGSTPLALVGPTFQHSILQLFLSGPNDKYFTVLSESNTSSSNDNIISNILGNIMALNQESSSIANFVDNVDSRDFSNISPSLSYLKNKTMQDVFEAEKNAVIEALIQSQKPVRHIKISLSKPSDIGMLFAYFIIETIITAKLFNINPFTQDAVESVKTLTKTILEQK